MIRFRFGGFLLFGLGCLGLEGAGADDDADGQGDGADGRRGRIGPRPAPYGAEGLHGRSRYGTVGRCCRWRRCRRRVGDDLTGAIWMKGDQAATVPREVGDHKRLVVFIADLQLSNPREATGVKFLNEAEAGHKSYVTIDFVPSSRPSAQKRSAVHHPADIIGIMPQRVNVSASASSSAWIGHSNDATERRWTVWRLSPELTRPEPRQATHRHP